MAAPSTITVSYGASSSASLPIPKPNGTTPMDFTQFVREIFENGGAWFVTSGGINTFIVWATITSITAQ